MTRVRGTLIIAASFLIVASALMLNIGASLTVSFTSKYHPVGRFLNSASSMYVFVLGTFPTLLFLYDRRRSSPLDVFVAYVATMVFVIEAFILACGATVLTYYFYWTQS